MWLFFFFTDTATTEIYTLSLHDALPICLHGRRPRQIHRRSRRMPGHLGARGRSEEHTSELQSHVNLVCRLLLEKKKQHGQSPEESCFESLRTTRGSILDNRISLRPPAVI